MQLENQTLNKLKSIADFIKSSGRFFFQNYNLKIFLNFLDNDSEISIIINTLLSENQHIKNKLNQLQNFENFNLNKVRNEIKTFEEQVAFCLYYLKTVVGEVKCIENFINPADGIGASEKNKDIFFEECIKPVILYIELELNSTKSALYTLDRYKTLCEWFDREKILSMKDEPEITKTHLSKHLFDSGFFNYSFYETNVPSGRIDNLAIRLGSDDKKHPNIVFAEGKFFKNKSSIHDVFNQTEKRIRDLGLYEGFCVIFNKINNKLKIINATGNINGHYYLDINNARIYFIIINLYPNNVSTATQKDLEIDLSSLSKM